MMYRLQCAELWGGVKNEDLDVGSSGLTLSLYSSASDGDRGGDVYYFSVCNADRVTRAVLADVAGHGRHVSQLGQWLHDEMAARLDDPDLSSFMADLNQRACGVKFGRFATAVAISYYRDLGQVYFCNAGHPPMLVGRRGKRWTTLATRSTGRDIDLPLGVSKSARYVMYHVDIGQSDALLLYSDGVLEVFNRQREAFGLDGLLGTLNALGPADPAEIKSVVLASLKAWRQEPLDHDDLTLIILQPVEGTVSNRK